MDDRKKVEAAFQNGFSKLDSIPELVCLLYHSFNKHSLPVQSSLRPVIGMLKKAL